MGVIRQPEVKSHDPKGINSHLKVQFQDVLAEPKGTHSCSCIWQASQCCFQFCFSLCYGLAVAFTHLWLAACWGAHFAHVAFLHVWVTSPLLHCLSYVLHVPAACWRLCSRCLLDPWCEASAYVFMFFERPPLDTARRENWMPMSILARKGLTNHVQRIPIGHGIPFQKSASFPKYGNDD